MVVNERITSYLHSLGSDNGDFLEALRIFAEETDVPIIRREMEGFIRVVLEMQKPSLILELGTGVAYSAVFMAENSDAAIMTVENYEKRIKLAEENIIRSGYKDRITLVKGDAAEVVGNFARDVKADTGEQFDMIFLDSAKAQYVEMLPDLMTILKKDGILIADNVLQDGELVESRFITERRQRTIHERMRQFLYEVTHSKELKTSIITLGDGVSLSIKTNDQKT